ncbi:MAG: DUF992 domain-containing protein [Hyphomicrobiaceae bacterium]
MMSYRFATLAAAVAASLIAASEPARSQPAVQIGMLNCEVAGGAGFVLGSSKPLTCLLQRPGPDESYTGSIDKIGIDIGQTSKTVIQWAVLAASKDIPRGALAGTYGGLTGEATIGVGLGANVLVGGLKNSIALQPVSVQAQQGLNLAAGIATLTLRSRY